MPSVIGQVMDKIAEHVEETNATTGITKCLIGFGGEAELPFARIVKSGGQYGWGDATQGDINSQLDKSFLIEIGIYGTEEQVDLAIETLEDLWLVPGGTPMSELHALGVWDLQPKTHNHPILFAEDSAQPGVLQMLMWLRRNYSTS